jgi:hypothetical protein
MELSFSMDGATGRIAVEVGLNDDPEAIGSPPAARGFPCCRATVSHPARGYAAAMGWIQLVRSTDGASRGAAFEMDPFEPLGPVGHPFAFFGFLPTLFDAPWRDPVVDMDWLAHTFLCRLTDSYEGRGIAPLAGFAWGFSIRTGEIAPITPEGLPLEAWDSHRSLLASEHPDWSFARGAYRRMVGDRDGIDV